MTYLSFSSSVLPPAKTCFYCVIPGSNKIQTKKSLQLLLMTPISNLFFYDSTLYPFILQNISLYVEGFNITIEYMAEYLEFYEQRG